MICIMLMSLLNNGAKVTFSMQVASVLLCFDIDTACGSLGRAYFF